ncbi:MAG TPA: hypothetical protein VIK55_06625 [Paludibacter sp.]
MSEKNKKAIIHEFDPVLYPFKIWVTITKNMEGIKERFEYISGKEFNVSNTEMFNAFVELVVCKESRKVGCIISFESIKICTTKLMAHEATHAARELWDRIGEKETGWEADAYLVGWIADCIEKVKLNKL